MLPPTAGNGVRCLDTTGAGAPVYTRMSRWVKAGVLGRLFEHLQRKRLMRVLIEALRLDATIVKMYPHSTGARKKTAPRPSAAAEVAVAPNFIWLLRPRETSSLGA